MDLNIGRGNNMNNINEDNHLCRVCGLYVESSPWGDDGKCPTYEICPCCGVEFGNEDYTIESTIEYRIKWLNNGAKWFDCKDKPLYWVLEEQLKQIPREYKQNP